MDNLKHKCYNQKVHIINGYSEIPVDTKCNGFVAINKSDVIMYVNDVPLYPSSVTPLVVSGESYGISGNSDEIYVGRITVSFASGATKTLGVIIQKYFVD